MGGLRAYRTVMPGLDPGIHLQRNALFLMDCRGKPGNDDFPIGGTCMRLNLPAYLIVLALLAPMLGGCLERGQPTLVNADGDDDDAFCQRNNVKAGSSEYIACRKDRDVQRNNANARADRRQRDLGEYMLNHPDHP
jgi:hypothetical protein